MSFVINWKMHFKCIVLSIIITFLFYNQFSSIIGNFLEYNIFDFPVYIAIINFYVSVILIMLPVSMVHEFIHGFVFRILGGKVKYGFNGIYAFTQEVSGIAIEKNKFLIVLLMPLVVISLLCLIINTKIFNMIFMLNLLGSSGDIFMGLTLVKYDSKCLIIDKKYGYDVIYRK